MFGWTGTIDLECDSPPYRVVEACSELGLREPLDVPWWRLSRYREDRGRPTGLIRRLVRSLLFTDDSADRLRCRCGKPVPELDCYTFTFVNERQASYRIGQCAKCRTVYWDDASPRT